MLDPIMLTPGVLRVSPRVWQAASRRQLNHRSEVIIEALQTIRQNLSQILGLSEDYFIVFFNASGRGAVEAAISSMVEGKKCLIVSNGTWADYMAAIARSYNPNVAVKKLTPDRPIDAREFDSALTELNPEVVFVVAHETERGLLNNVAELSSLAKRHKCRIIIDAMSAVVVEEIDYEALLLDMIIFNSVKALRSIGPIGMVAIKKSIAKDLRESSNYYLNLKKEYVQQSQHVLPVNSLSPLAVLALAEATTELLEEGVEKRRADIKRRMQTLKIWALSRELKFGIEPIYIGNFTLPLYLPKPWTYQEFNKALQQAGYFVRSGAEGEKGNTIEICPVGYLSDEDINGFTEVADQILGFS